MRCMVAYGGHAPVANTCEFEFENESQISNSNIIQVGARFRKWEADSNSNSMRELALVGKSHQSWEETPKSIKGTSL